MFSIFLKNKMNRKLREKKKQKQESLDKKYFNFKI